LAETYLSLSKAVTPDPAVTLHVRYVGESCAQTYPGRDEPPLRYPVPASSKIEYYELSYPYELVESRETHCD
jgi:hypothetical protein